MSHDYGQVYLKSEDGEYNNLFGHFEYNGTCDVACTAIQSSIDNVKKHWRSELNLSSCDCKDKKYTWTRLHSNYGGGFDWFAEICEKCMCIVSNRMPFEPSIDNGRYQFPISPVDYFDCNSTPPKGKND